MRIFKNNEEMIKEVERELIHNGEEVFVETVQDQNVSGKEEYLTKELLGFSYLVRDIKDYTKLMINLKLNEQYLFEEFKERLSGQKVNPGLSWTYRPEVWKPFLYKEGKKLKFSYTYSQRIENQFEKIVKLLTKNPRSRQGILTVYDKHFDIKYFGGEKRIPCSMYYQFFRRLEGKEEKLNLVYTMRSCDFKVHFGYDVVLAQMMQEYMSKLLSLPTGNFIHFIGSLHIFKKDAPEVF